MLRASSRNPLEAIPCFADLDASVSGAAAEALREVAGYYLKAQGAAAEQYLLQTGFTPGMVAKAKASTAHDYMLSLAGSMNQEL